MVPFQVYIRCTDLQVKLGFGNKGYVGNKAIKQNGEKTIVGSLKSLAQGF